MDKYGKTITMRLRPEEMEKLTKARKQTGLSDGQFAKKALMIAMDSELISDIIILEAEKHKLLKRAELKAKEDLRKMNIKIELFKKNNLI
tara:strand:+ start:114 stop:383 length:270 start_codon:yes stop_codon:yes gene_type:complete